LRLHEGVRRRAGLAGHAPEPDRGRHGRDHAGGHRPLVRPVITPVGPGVHRLGSERVNFYFVEAGGRVTVVDAGVSGYWDQVEPGLAQIGRGLDDVAAVVLTHAHSDHTGVAGKLHERGVPVLLNPADQELLKTGKEPWKREGGS